MEIKEIFQDINWKSLIIGSAIFSFIVVLAMDNQLDILLVFSSAGLLYIGYASKNRLQGIVLGAIGTVPLFLVTVFTERLGAISGNNLVIWILISFLAIGAFCGFTGAYFSESRKKAIEQQIAMEKTKSKNKKNKGSKIK